MVTYDDLPLKPYALPEVPVSPSVTWWMVPGWLPVASVIVPPLVSSMCHTSWVAWMTAAVVAACAAVPRLPVGERTAAQAATAVMATARAGPRREVCPDTSDAPSWAMPGSAPIWRFRGH